MNTRTVCTVAALAGVSLLPLSLPARAQPPETAAPAGEAAPAKKKPGKGPDMAAMMAAWEKAATPGEPHKQLLKRVGSWTVATKMWMNPGEPPAESTGTCETKAILGDRFIESTFSSTMMGKPFTGIGINGYDNTKKKFVGTWVDSSSTGILRMEGTADASGKTMTSTTTASDPMTGKESHMRIVNTWNSDTKITEEFFEKRGGKDVKTMELVYTKK